MLQCVCVHTPIGGPRKRPILKHFGESDGSKGGMRVSVPDTPYSVNLFVVGVLGAIWPVSKSVSKFDLPLDFDTDFYTPGP